MIMGGYDHRTISQTRSWTIIGILGCVVAGLTWRLVDLHVFNQEFLQNQSNARTLRTIPITAHRGIIADRNGEPLAVSAPVAAVWINPQLFINDPPSLVKLARPLAVTPEFIQQRLQDKANSEFVYLKRQLDPYAAQQVKKLNLPGVFVEREYRRYFPTGEVSAHVLGFTNIDGEGQEGLEVAFNDLLRGEAGARQVVKDRLGRIIDEIKHIRDPKPGENLYLSIDRRIQYLAYRELLYAIHQHQAASGSVVVVNVRTGEILAMVNYPTFNPNNPLDRNTEHMRNRAVTDVLEPGSLMKTFSMLAALESGSVQLETQVDTHPGFMRLQGKTVKDVNNFGVIDMTGVLKHSSNIGIAEVILAAPFANHLDILQRFGFSAPTASGFPGERTGYVNVPRESDEHGRAALAFGYGLAVTPLQLTQAYAVIANHGRAVPLTFLRQDAHNKHNEQIIAPQLAKQMQSMLMHVVHDARGVYRAKVPGYQVSGKSGTSRKATVAGGYDAKRYTASFAGFAPTSDPHLAMVVVIDDPSTGTYYGGAVAAPVFSQVMSGALRLFNVTPDLIEPEFVAAIPASNAGKASTVYTSGSYYHD